MVTDISFAATLAAVSQGTLLLHWLWSVGALCCYTGCGQSGHFAATLAVVSRGTLLLHWLWSVGALCCYTGCGQPGHFAAMLAVVSRGTLLPMPSSKRVQGSHTVVNSYWDKLMLG